MVSWSDDREATSALRRRRAVIDRVPSPPEGFFSRFHPGFDRFRPKMRLDPGFPRPPGQNFSVWLILINFDPKITPKMRFILVALEPAGLLLFTEAYCCSVVIVNNKNSARRLTLNSSRGGGTACPHAPPTNRTPRERYIIPLETPSAV